MLCGYIQNCASHPSEVHNQENHKKIVWKVKNGAKMMSDTSNPTNMVLETSKCHYSYIGDTIEVAQGGQL